MRNRIIFSLLITAMAVLAACTIFSVTAFSNSIYILVGDVVESAQVEYK